MDENEKFWIEDPSILFKKDNYYRIIPTREMTQNEVFNSLTRLFIYLGILLYLLSRNAGYLLIPISSIVVIVIIYHLNKQERQSSELFEPLPKQKTKCKEPTLDNPMMNITMGDLMDNPTRGPACRSDDLRIKKKMEKYLSKGTIFGPNDVFDKKHLNRQFYTMPSTTLPNNQTDFARWLYQIPETCKENSNNCVRYEDVRYLKSSPLDSSESSEKLVT